MNNIKMKNLFLAIIATALTATFFTTQLIVGITELNMVAQNGRYLTSAGKAITAFDVISFFAGFALLVVDLITLFGISKNKSDGLTMLTVLVTAAMSVLLFFINIICTAVSANGYNYTFPTNSFVLMIICGIVTLIYFAVKRFLDKLPDKEEKQANSGNYGNDVFANMQNTYTPPVNNTPNMHEENMEGFMSMADRVKKMTKYKSLLDKGLITKEEYDKLSETEE